MAQKAKSSQAKAAPKREATIKSTKPRNTTVPPKARAAKQQEAKPLEITREMIAERAYYLWLSGAPGCEYDHWCAAERDLRGK